MGPRGAHAFLANIHPFDPSVTSGVAHPEECFEDEGIGLLIPREISDFTAAIAKANLGDRPFSALTECRDGRMVAWRFEVLNPEKRDVIDIVTVPRD